MYVGREEGVEDREASALPPSPPSRLFRTRRPLLGGREGGFARRRRKKGGSVWGCCTNARARAQREEKEEKANIVKQCEAEKEKKFQNLPFLESKSTSHSMSNLNVVFFF